MEKNRAWRSGHEKQSSEPENVADLAGGGCLLCAWRIGVGGDCDGAPIRDCSVDRNVDGGEGRCRVEGRAFGNLHERNGVE